MKSKSPIVKVDWTGRMEVYSSSDYLPVRALAHRVKDGDKDGITKAAHIMQTWYRLFLTIRMPFLFPCQEEKVRQVIPRFWPMR